LTRADWCEERDERGCDRCLSDAARLKHRRRWWQECHGVRMTAASELRPHEALELWGW